MPWKEVAKVHEVVEGESKVVIVDGRALALFKTGGEIFCIDNICKHQGGPLGEGFLNDGIVTCPWHGWRYDIRTGKSIVAPDISVDRFDVKIEKDKILI